MDALPLELIIKALVAIFLGGAIGLERELAGRPAGLRTNILICVGSMLMMDLSMKIAYGPTGQQVGDPGRIAAQVVTGIGFLGAGAIVHARGTVQGLTTAAGIWVVCAIGLAVGAGRYADATAITVLVVFVLVGLRRVERAVLEYPRKAHIVVWVRQGTAPERLEQLCREAGIECTQRKVRKVGEQPMIDLDVIGSARQLEVANALFAESNEVVHVEVE